MSRARFVADRPLLWVLAIGVATAVVVDAVSGTWSAMQALLLVVVVGSVVEGLYRADTAASQREADANARWALTGLMVESQPWPPMGGWALGPAAVSEWIRRISQMNAPKVVELGPGTSTLLLARALPEAAIFAVEHDPLYADRIRELSTGLVGLELVEAPLRTDSNDVAWYASEALAGLPDHIDALLVDGPPNWNGKGNRAPARRIIEDHMSQGGLVLVDDAHRRDERSMIRAWVKDGLCRVLQDAGSYVFLEKT